MNTTISISTEMRNKIKEFGSKGESYTDILERWYKSFRDQQIREILMDESDCIPVREALLEAKKKWPK